MLALEDEHAHFLPPFRHWDPVAFHAMDVAIAEVVGSCYGCSLLTKQCVWGSGVRKA